MTVDATNELPVCAMARLAAEVLLNRWAGLTDRGPSLSCHPVVMFFDEKTGVISEIAYIVTRMPGVEIGVSFFCGQLHAILVDPYSEKTFTLVLDTSGKERLN